jgi:hypothetical protein
MSGANVIRSCIAHIKNAHSILSANAYELHRSTNLVYYFVIMDSQDGLRPLSMFPSRRAPRRPPPYVPEIDPYHLLSDDSDIERILGNHDDTGAISDDSVDLGYLEQLRAQRLRRKSAAYPYSGDLIMAVNNLHNDESKNWRSLPPTEQQRRWMTEFRMPEAVFDELFELVEPHMEPSVPQNSQQRTYTVREKLLVTLSFLAHCNTLRQMATKFGMPHSSLSVLCIRPTVNTFRKVFILTPETKNIRWPVDPEDQERVMQGFRDECRVPGCLGAIDGSLIPMKKPTKQQANQDADSYYGYKGGIASLLLAVCDINMKFTYVSAGAPACVGDAGLFQRSQLHQNIEGGVMAQINVPLYLENDGMKAIMPYLVGDAAFPLGVHMMKAIDPPPAVPSAEAEFNKRILLARRVIERCFGRLKGRWVFCKRNAFWNDLEFSRAAIESCCALHNFLEERKVELPGAEGVVQHVGMAVGDNQGLEEQSGEDTRDMLVKWVELH